eukprot:c22609_g1_i2 orf=465-1910(-)
MEQFVNFVIRPPRSGYSLQDLLQPEFVLKGRKYQRKDLEIANKHGHILRCSHFMPEPFPEDIQLPCVIYCHGNSGCRADGNEAALVLLPSNITVFTLDFSGSGLSDGDYVSLGWNEKDDLQAVVSYIRSMKQISFIGLWGRSMGAVTSLLYSAEDPSIAGMVLDSPFSNLFDLMVEFVNLYKIRLPKFTVKVALQIMRRIIQKRAHFDIMDLNVVQVATKSFIPALFGHATEDSFIQPHHSDRIHAAYVGDKNIIKFEGDHNSPRPRFYYDSVAIFFHNVLHPPEVSNDNIGVPCGCVDESERSLPFPKFSASESQLLNGFTMGNETFYIMEGCPQSFSELKGASCSGDCLEPSSSLSLLEMKGVSQHDDCFSYPSSNCASTESWGQCSSPGISDTSEDGLSFKENLIDTPRNSDDEERMIMEAIAASLEDTQKEQPVILQSCNVATELGRKGKLETLSHLLKSSCLKGMRCRHKGVVQKC